MIPAGGIQVIQEDHLIRKDLAEPATAAKVTVVEIREDKEVVEVIPVIREEAVRWVVVANKVTSKYLAEEKANLKMKVRWRNNYLSKK